MPKSSVTAKDDEQKPAEASQEEYVDVTAFEAVGELGESIEGKDWTEAFSPEELEEHEAELRSVVNAQQEAEVLGTEVVIGW